MRLTSLPASYVTSPAFGEIAPGVDGLLAEDITSGSYVSTPALVEVGAPVEPEVPVGGGGGGPGYGWGREGEKEENAADGNWSRPSTGPSTGLPERPLASQSPKHQYPRSHPWDRRWT